MKNTTWSYEFLKKFLWSTLELNLPCPTAHAIILFPDFFPGMPKSLQKASELTGKPITFHEVDICDKNGLRKVFDKTKIDCVIHIAALKSVSESFESPLKYYSVNVKGSINLVEVMEEYKVKNIVFSSSATVFGEPEYSPIDEDHPTGRVTR